MASHYVWDAATFILAFPCPTTSAALPAANPAKLQLYITLPEQLHVQYISNTQLERSADETRPP